MTNNINNHIKGEKMIINHKTNKKEPSPDSETKPAIWETLAMEKDQLFEEQIITYKKAGKTLQHPEDHVDFFQHKEFWKLYLDTLTKAINIDASDLLHIQKRFFQDIKNTWSFRTLDSFYRNAGHDANIKDYSKQIILHLLLEILNEDDEEDEKDKKKKKIKAPF